MKTGFIYSLNDPTTNEPKYIGCTSKTIKYRYNNHLYEKGSNNNKKCNWIKSLKTKGLRPVIEEIDKVNLEEMFFWEMYYVSLYKSWGFELKNTTNGGANNDVLNREYAKVPILQYSLNGEFIQEWRSCVDASNFFGKSPHFIKAVLRGKRGSTHGYMWRRKTSNYKLKIKPANLFPNKKEVIQYDLNGNFIKVWDCAREAAKALGLSEHTLSYAAKGKHAYCGNFIWKIKTTDEISLFVNPVNKKIDSWSTGSRFPKIILQYDLNGNFIREWKRASDIKKETTFCISQIYVVCLNRKGTSGGYIWKYKEYNNVLN